MRAELRHDQIRGEIKNDIANVEQRQASRDLFGGQVHLRCKVMADVAVHRLGETDIGTDGGAEEIEDPECCGRA